MDFGRIFPVYNLSLVMRKPAFCICANKDADQLTAKLISAFGFAIRIVRFLYYLNPKFQASSHLLWLYSLVCVGPGRKPRRPFFSERGSFLVVSDFEALFELCKRSGHCGSLWVAIKWGLNLACFTLRLMHGGKTWSCEECTLWCCIYIAIVKTGKSAFSTWLSFIPVNGKIERFSVKYSSNDPRKRDCETL